MGLRKGSMEELILFTPLISGISVVVFRSTCLLLLFTQNIRVQVDFSMNQLGYVNDSLIWSICSLKQMLSTLRRLVVHFYKSVKCILPDCKNVPQFYAAGLVIKMTDYVAAVVVTFFLSWLLESGVKFLLIFSLLISFFFSKITLNVPFIDYASTHGKIEQCSEED